MTTESLGQPNSSRGAAAALRALFRPAADRIRRSLRARVALGISLPILLALAALSGVHYWRERHLLDEQAGMTARQMGQIITSGLRRAMALNDHDLLVQTLRDVGYAEPVRRVQIVDLEGRIQVDSGFRTAGQVQHAASPGCNQCHRLAAGSRPESVLLPAEQDLLRVAVPIDNRPECAACHPAQDQHLGILLVDMSVRVLREHVVQDLQLDLAISGLITLLLTIGVFLLVHRLVVSRVETFRRPLAAFAAGHYAARLPVNHTPDEMGELALAFNRMADELERHLHEEQARSELRQRAIIEERERIARELHDGLAQVLGYVKNKATAVRLLLRRDDTQAAEKQLGQLEEAAGSLFVDVREAILGLRLTGRRDLDFTAMLKDYAEHFSRLSDLPVEVAIAPGVAQAVLPVESEVQLLRIVQEALTNARKHAAARTARIQLQNGGNRLELRVGDDGRGFDLEHVRRTGRPHFGLSSMRERAEAIGAEFAVESAPGQGTQIVIRLELNGNGKHAHPGR